GAVAPAPEKSPAATAATAIDTQQPTGATATGAPHPAEPPTLATDAAQAAHAAQAAEAPGTPESATPPAPASSPATSGAAELRRLWSEVMVRLREIKRTPWSLISQESTVVDVADGVLTLAFRQPTLRDTFVRREDFQNHLRQAITDVLGVDLRVNAIVDPSAGGNPQQSGAREGGAPAVRPDPPSGSRPAAQSAPAASARAAVRAAAANPSGATSQATEPEPDHDAHPDDSDVDDSGVSERELLERTLGARVIQEIDHT